MGIGGHRAWLAPAPRARLLRLVLPALVVVAAIGGAGWYAVGHAEGRAMAAWEATLTSIADLKAGQMAAWRRERSGDGVLIQGSYRLQQPLVRPADPEAHAQALAYLRTFQQGREYVALALFDGQGRMLAAVPDDGWTAMGCLQKHVREGLAAPRAVLTEMHRSGQNQPVHLGLLCPLRLHEGTVGPADGVVLLLIDPTRVLYPSLQSWPLPNRTGEGLLVGRDGEAVVWYSETPRRPGAAASLRVPLTRTDMPAVQAVLGTKGLLQGVDDRGRQVMAVGRPVANSPWAVVATIDRDEAAQDWGRERQQAAAVATACALAMLLGLGAVWRQQRLRLVERELAERQRAERALRAREEVFASIVTQAMDAIVLVDGARGSFVEFNTAAHEGMGYTREEFAQLTIADLQAEQTPAEIRRNIEAIHQRGGLVFETRHRRRDGEIRDVRVSARLLRLQDRDCMAAMWSDITERRRTERALQENEARFRAVFDQAVDGIMLLSADGSRMQTNAAFARLHGYDDAAQMASLTLADLDTPTSAAHIADRLQRAVAGEILNFETEHCRRDGSVVPLSVAASRVRLGNEWHVLAFHRDISERRRRDAYRAMGQWIQLILGETGEVPAVLQRMLHLVQASTAADVVDLRLNPGLGLPSRLSVGGQAETTATPLSPTSADPLAQEDAAGGEAVNWERLADMVAAGQVPPGVRSTPGGSLWVDDVEQITEPPPAVGLPAAAWGRFLGGGYRAAVLVTVRAKGRAIGWLHLRTRAGGQQTRESVEALEDAARSMGEAMLRRSAENELRASQEQLRQAVDRAPEAILMVDAHGHITLWNDAATLLFGYARHEVLGQDLDRVIPRERLLTAATQAGPPDTGADRRRPLALAGRHRDGREVPIEASVARVGLHGAWGHVAIVRHAGPPA